MSKDSDKVIPQLSNKAFWDTDMKLLDFDKQKKAIIGRVFNDGTWNDILAVWNYYGDAIVVDSLVTAAYLKRSAVLLAAKMFKIDPKLFKCYEKIQSQKSL